jgi:hypothetical protein
MIFTLYSLETKLAEVHIYEHIVYVVFLDNSTWAVKDLDEASLLVQTHLNKKVTHMY